MNRRIVACTAFAATLVAPAAPLALAAPPAAVVEAVQMPAWVERDGARVALAPGMVLRQGDGLRTGANSRLLLRTADGSAVKLGEKAFLSLETMRLEKKANVFEAAMKVSEGAFRFTTELFARFARKRVVNITVATVTAGIRGTDLWGKSAPERQILCLIEGKIEVSPPGEPSITMSEPLSFYVRERGQSQPVATVPTAQLAQWSAETETQPGEGVSRRGGRWKLTLAVIESERDALALYQTVREAGYAAEIHPVRRKGKRAYDVRLSHFASRADAEKVAVELKRSGRLGDYEPKASL